MAGPPELRREDGARLEALLARGWALPPRQHPLARLQGHRLGTLRRGSGPACRLLALLGPKNNVGARYLQLFLVDAAGRLSREPLALGLHNSGPFPGYNWIELTRYAAAAAFNGDRLDLAARRLDRRLFRLLAALLPAGGHLMVEYESPGQRETERLLALGYPPATTPLGHLLFAAGCRSFRDWYIPEGGREGPRKLQGFLPLDADVAREKTERLRQELSALLSRPPARTQGELGRRARRRAGAALRALQ